MSTKKAKLEPSPEELFVSIQQNESLREEPPGLGAVLRTVLRDVKNLVDAVSGLTTKKDNSIRMLSELEVKTDTIVQKVNHIETLLTNRGVTTSAGGEPSTSYPLKRPFMKVMSLKDLESLDVKCHDQEFMKDSIKFFGLMHGKGRFMGDGVTVCLQLFDSFFDRHFMLSCSWTGAGKNQKKIPFIRFEKVIDLFFRVVCYSDPSFTLDQTNEFLHRCLRNATQRVKEVNGKKSVSRKRKRRVSGENFDLIQEGEQSDHGNEEQEDGTFEQQQLEEDIEQQQPEVDTEQEEDFAEGTMKIEILEEEIL